MIESARLERFRAGHGFADVIDIDRDRADAGAMSDVVRMGKAIGLAIDDQIDVALRPPFDVLAAMGTGFAKAELAE